MIVDEWHVSGEPGPIRAVPQMRYPSYHFVYRSDDERWSGAEAEQVARAFVKRCFSETDPMKRWEDGPHLFHRTVTYSALEPVPVEQETPGE